MLTCRKKELGMLYEDSLLALYYLLGVNQEQLEAPSVLYGKTVEEQETSELLAFVEMAKRELDRRDTLARQTVGNAQIRITSNLRIFVGTQEVRVRPMAKCVLLLFLKHPEGIVLKEINDYYHELRAFYRRLSRSGSPEAIEQSVQNLIDICNNNLNINISRANSAIAGLVSEPGLYTIQGPSGHRKSIRLSRSLVVWE